MIKQNTITKDLHGSHSKTIELTFICVFKFFMTSIISFLTIEVLRLNQDIFVKSLSEQGLIKTSIINLF